MKHRAFTLAGVVLTLLLLAPAMASAEMKELEFEKYILPNGLQVILHEDHAIPMVSVNVWYHVGSKNEKPGRTGFAHLFEHMMFQGSQHHDTDYFAPLEKVGGSANGSTATDRTNYWENVPSNYLELALWLEADRMGYLLPAMTQEKLDNQRDVVKNERRQGVDNVPYGKSSEILLSLMYPSDHPYSWPVIGSMDDLTAASLEDVKNFFRHYYTPNNASLCVAGDFDPSTAKAMIEKYFGPIPPGPAIERMEDWVPRLEGEKRAVTEDNVELPRLYMSWHTPAYYAPGDADFDLLANILSSGKNSRLYKSLVYEMEIAQDVRAFQSSREIASTFNIIATAREGHSLKELEKAIDMELNKLLTEGITPSELKQAQTVWEANFVRNLEEVGGFGGRADLLNSYNVYLGDPGKLLWDMQRYTKATKAEVEQYLNDYIDLNRRAVLYIVPQGTLASSDEQTNMSVEPKPMPEPEFEPPAIQTATLDNGLEIYLVENHQLPLVDMSVVIKSGWSDDPLDRFGAGALTANLLDEGTKSRSALDIAEEVKSLGARFNTSSDFDGSTVSLNILKKNFDQGLDLVADVLLNPTFPKEELERKKKIYLGQIQQESKQPVPSAIKAFQKVMYGSDHPYSQPYTGSGTPASINAIERDDLVSFYKAYYKPNNAAIAISGDITMDNAKKLLSAAFKKWEPGEVVRKDVPAPAMPSKTTFYLVDKPGAVQSVIIAGNPAMSREDPDYMPFRVMNNVLGGQFTSRINMNLREDKGYTYGARTLVMARRGVGPFLCYAPVQSQNTVESIVEIMKEFKGVLGQNPIGGEELQDSKNSLVKRFPRNFQSLSGITGLLETTIEYDLPLNRWNTYVNRVDAVTTAEATNMAQKYIHPDQSIFVVVGDVSKIADGIRGLNMGEVKILDEKTLSSL